MLLHDNIIFFAKLKAVVEFHCEVKLLNYLLYIKCISVMADNDKTLIGDGNLTNNNKNHGIPNIVPNSLGALPSDTLPTQLAAGSEPSTVKRKQTSFQITSVTVKGSRLSTDGGDDSADDLDDSHASSDVLDCSRTTDDQLSEDNNLRNDDTSITSPSIPVKSKSDEPVLLNAQVSSLKFSSDGDKLNSPSINSQNVDVNPPTLPDQCQHRFKVVKIVSSEPFKRGRWLCLDFLDPPAPIVEAKPEVSDISASSIQLISGSISDSIPSDRMAHIYEISPSDSYPGSISVAVGSDQIQQPMYGIFLPINNGHPFITGMHTKVTPAQKEVTLQESQRPIAIPNDHTVKQAAPDHMTFPTQMAHVVPGIVASQSVSMPQVLPTTQGMPTASISQIVPPPQGVPIATMPQVSASQGTPVSTMSLAPQGGPVASMPQTVSAPQGVPIASISQAMSAPQGIPVSSIPQGISVAPVPHAVSVPQGVPAASNLPAMSAPQGIPVASMPQAMSATQSTPVASMPQVTTTPQGVPVTSMQQAASVSQGVPVTAVPQVVSTSLGAHVSSKPQATQPVQVGQSESHISQTVPIQPTVADPIVQLHSLPSQAPSQESHTHTQSVIPVQVAPHTAESRIDTASMPATVHSSSHTTEFSQTNQLPPIQQVPLQQTSMAHVSIPESTITTAKMPEGGVPNHNEGKELSPPSSNVHVSQEAVTDIPPTKSEANGEEVENVPSGTSTVAIDNKIEQAMDLVKSHLMFAVREEVDVLKEKITELMDRISQLEYENSYLRANATQQTLEQLNQTQLLQQQQQHQNTSSIVSMNSISQQPPQSEHLNTQNPQQTS